MPESRMRKLDITDRRSDLALQLKRGTGRSLTQAAERRRKTRRNGVFYCGTERAEAMSFFAVS